MFKSLFSALAGANQVGNAAAVVLGRCWADMINSLVGLTVLMGVWLLLGWRGDSWVTEHALFLALLWPLLLTAIFLPLSVRRCRHLSR